MTRRVHRSARRRSWAALSAPSSASPAPACGLPSRASRAPDCRSGRRVRDTCGRASRSSIRLDSPGASSSPRCPMYGAMGSTPAWLRGAPARRAHARTRATRAASTSRGTRRSRSRSLRTARARTGISRSRTNTAPSGSDFHARFHPVGLSFHDRTNTRSSTITAQMPRKRCGTPPARTFSAPCLAISASVSSAKCWRVGMPIPSFFTLGRPRGSATGSRAPDIPPAGNPTPRRARSRAARTSATPPASGPWCAGSPRDGPRRARAGCTPW